MKKITSLILVSILAISCGDPNPGDGYIPYEREEYTLKEALYDYRTVNEFDVGSAPTKGEVKALVFLVDFEDAPGTLKMKEEVDIAFNGKPEDTNWESLRSFYYKSSYGQLILNCDIKGWFRAKNPSAGESYKGGGSGGLIREAVEHFDSEIDYSEYDSNGDGTVDNIYMIYSRDYSTVDNSDWWAYKRGTGIVDKFDGMKTRDFFFASYKFLKDGDYNNVNNKGIDATTFIHETGHILGAPDYYDINYEVNGTHQYIGTLDMMAHNIGDHNNFTKMQYGWNKPFAIHEEGDTQSFTLEPLTKSPQNAVLIGIPFRDAEYDFPFAGEYYILEYYNVDHLNSAQGRITEPGLRLLRINTGNSSGAGISNTNSGSTANPMITLVRADRAGIDTVATNSHLFRNTNPVNMSSFIEYRTTNKMNFSFKLTEADFGDEKVTVEITITSNVR